MYWWNSVSACVSTTIDPVFYSRNIQLSDYNLISCSPRREECFQFYPISGFLLQQCWINHRLLLNFIFIFLKQNYAGCDDGLPRIIGGSDLVVFSSRKGNEEDWVLEVEAVSTINLQQNGVGIEVPPSHFSSGVLL